MSLKVGLLPSRDPDNPVFLISKLLKFTKTVRIWNVLVRGTLTGGVIKKLCFYLTMKSFSFFNPQFLPDVYLKLIF